MSAPRSTSRHWRIALIAAGATMLAGGCALGPRPQLAAPTATGSADADAFVATLTAGDAAAFTADYTVTVPMSGLTTTASVAQADVDDRGVTVGDIRYVFDQSGQARTCTVSTGLCDAGLDPARTSDTTLGYDWFSAGLRARLSTELAAATSVPTVSAATIAGQPATCLSFEVAGADGAAAPISYCRLENSVVARIARGDVTVELTSYSADVDRSKIDVTPAAS